MVSLFYSAEEIVFPHGSMFYYTIFCARNPRIIEFISEHRYREEFLVTAKHTGIDADNYKIITCKSDSPETNNITIDMNILKKEIR